MTLLHLDTSALFKRYVEETESEALLSRIVPSDRSRSGPSFREAHDGSSGVLTVRMDLSFPFAHGRLRRGARTRAW